MCERVCVCVGVCVCERVTDSDGALGKVQILEIVALSCTTHTHTHTHTVYHMCCAVRVTEAHQLS